MEMTATYEQKLLETEKRDQSADKIIINHTFEKLPDPSVEEMIPCGDSDRVGKESSAINASESGTDDDKLSESSDGSSSAAEVVKEIAQVVTALGHAFTKLVDIMLSVQIKVCTLSTHILHHLFHSQPPSLPTCNKLV